MVTPTIPLAEKLRPTCLSTVIGQRHLLAEGKALYNAYHQKEAHSFVLWGPPGTGKTTLAQILANHWDYHFIKLSAVFAGIKDIKQAIDMAEYQRTSMQKGTLLFVDEIHRFNKSQQDSFLPHLESGLLTLIGATTENPSFELNSALLSRLHVYVLNPLSGEELTRLFDEALKTLSEKVDFDPDAKAALTTLADGDARKLLNLLEITYHAALAKALPSVTLEFLQNTLPQQLRRFDKGGEQFYDQISALHKSVRGSDPDAALYWFCRMLDGGADPLYLGRRLIRIASEDIGLADPRALDLANHAIQSYERLGSPEGELALVQALIYLAVAPKSNAIYTAFNKAQNFVKKEPSRPVPLHLRNAPTQLMKDLDYGKDYRYAHDEPHHYAANVQYFPDNMSAHSFYQPTEQGLEAKIREKLKFLKTLDEKQSQ